jgi:uncharacterized protein (DUF2141 family)
MKTDLVLPLAAAVLFAGASALGAEGSRITVDVESLRSDSGVVRCALFTGAEGYPGDMAKAVAKTDAKIDGKKATCVFDGEPAGTYAVSLIHDEDGDGELKKNFLGIPKEGVGASNDAPHKTSAPKYDAARFTYDGGTLALTVHVGY